MNPKQDWYHKHSLEQLPAGFQYVGGVEYGINHLIHHHLSSLPAPVWFEITPREAQDPVLTANALVEAFNKVAGERVLDHGMTFPHVIGLLRRYSSVFEEHTFIFSGAHLVPECARAMMDLLPLGHRVMVISEQALDLPLPLITAQDLLFTVEEVPGLAADFGLSEAQVQDILTGSGGVFEPCWIRLHEWSRRPLPLRPTADGMRPPPGHEIEINPRVLISLLRKRGKPIQALEMAVQSCPELVPDLVEEAGNRALLTGAHAHLHRLLELLPKDIQQDEVVMRWRIEAACLVDKKEEIKDEVLAYLEAHEAPDVRAVAVLNYIFDNRVRDNVERANLNKISIHTLKSQILLNAYTFRIDDSEEYKMLFSVVEMAEKLKNPLEMIRIYKLVSFYLYSSYRHEEMIQWCILLYEYSLSLENLNATDKVHVLNYLMQAKILNGDFTDFDNLLREAETSLDVINTETYSEFLMIKSQYLFTTGKTELAESIWLDLWKKSDRYYKCYYSIALIKSAYTHNNTKLMKDISDLSFAIAEGVPEFLKIHAIVAYAYYKCITDPDEAINILKSNCKIIEENFHPSNFIVYVLVLLVCLKKLNRIDEFENTMELYEIILSRLSHSALKVYLGNLAPIVHSSKHLSLKFLGKHQIIYQGEVINLPLRQLEILCILSVNRQGLKGEELLMKIYGSDIYEGYGSLKTNISKLRKKVDIVASPYRILENYYSDVEELIDSIRGGNLDKILELYSNDLLPSSCAEGIEEIRIYIENNIRDLFINYGDLEKIYKLYQNGFRDPVIINYVIDRLDAMDYRKTILQNELSTLI